MSPHRKEIAKLLQSASHRHHVWDVFADFVEMSALALSNSVDWAQSEPREERYMRLIGKYSAEEQRLVPRVLASLVTALEDGPADVLGSVFGELNLGNAARGQFFTPYEICRLMARILIGDGAALRHEIEQKGFVTVSEPACGAGAMVIAFAEAMQEAGFNYQQHLHVTAIDVDARAAHMAYLQFSLLHIPAVVVLGNTLTLEEREHWRTPAHLMGMWDRKLARGYALGSALDREGEPGVQPPVPIEAPFAPAIVMPSAQAMLQLSLFEEAA